MASKCFCDACGAEMPATGSRRIEITLSLTNGAEPTYAVDTQAHIAGFDVCERCICKAFAAKLDEPKPGAANWVDPKREASPPSRFDNKTVSREPTDAMFNAALRVDVNPKAVWRAMYDAA